MTNGFETQMIARLAHIDLYNRFSHALDQRDWPALAPLFTEDAEFVTTVNPSFKQREAGKTEEVPIKVQGRDTIVSTITAFVGSVSATHHLMSNHVVDINPDGKSASARAYARAYHVGRGSKADLFEESLARFDIETVLEGSTWKIRKMHEVILIMLGTTDVFG